MYSPTKNERICPRRLEHDGGLEDITGIGLRLAVNGSH
jgi:hypothetical protein